jgi:thymidylate synthase (FAD)
MMEAGVLNDGYVRVVDSMTSDLSVVNAARVSFGKTKKQLSDGDIGLINFLMRERHGTPFEHNAITFHVKCPIFVAREWFRHRIGSFNEFSARYSEVPNDFFVPEADSVRTQVGKPGAYTFEQVAAPMAESTIEMIKGVNERCFEVYEHLIRHGVAKELARTVLPMGTYTQFYWTVNARSLMNFLSLRSHETAQREIREYSLAIEQMFEQLMPHTFTAWMANNRVAP